MASHEKRRFAEKLDYISLPGYLDGGDSWEMSNFPEGGTSSIISNLGTLRLDPVIKEFCLDAYFPFSSVEEIKDKTGWELKVYPNVKMVSDPDDE